MAKAPPQVHSGAPRRTGQRTAMKDPPRVHGCHVTSTGACPGPGPCPRASRPRPPGATPSLGDTHHAGRLRHSHLRFSPGTSPGSGCRILHHVQGEDTWFGDGILKLGLPGIEVRDTSIHSKACSNGPGPHHAPLHHGSGISLRILPKVMVRNPAFSSKRCRPPYRHTIYLTTTMHKSSDLKKGGRDGIWVGLRIS